jgi:hypothetical protein
MICPNCGGILNTNLSDTMCKCEYCGSKQIILDQHGDGLLERYNKCPLCKRNDQVKAISAVLGGIGDNQRFKQPSPPISTVPSKPVLSEPQPLVYVIFTLCFIFCNYSGQN